MRDDTLHAERQRSAGIATRSRSGTCWRCGGSAGRPRPSEDRSNYWNTRDITVLVQRRASVLGEDRNVYIAGSTATLSMQRRASALGEDRNLRPRSM